MLPRRLVFVYLAATLVQAVGWYLLAPDALCYVQEGQCIWQMDQSSSPYFFADLIFGAFGLAIGLLAGWIFASRLQASRFSQLFAALLAIGLGWIASQVVAALTEVQLLESSLGFDELTLRSTSMLFVWPLAVQLLVVFRTPKPTVSTSELLEPSN